MAKRPSLTTSKSAERAARDERLARALRENLRRRKEWARARQKLPSEKDAGKPPA